jgi:hypothetical protein
MLKFLLIILLFTTTSFSQTLTGVVSDTLNTPLENANVIAKPLQEKATLKFATANRKKIFKLKYFIKLQNRFFCNFIVVNQKISFNFKF